MKSMTWRLCMLLLMQSAGTVRALGRSPGLHVGPRLQGRSPGLDMHPKPQGIQNVLPAQPSESGLGVEGKTSEGISRLRVASHKGNDQQHEQRQSQIWTILMSVVLLFWIFQAIRHGLKSLYNFSNMKPGLQISVEVVDEPLQACKAPIAPSPPQSEQLKCLISELKSSAQSGDARLPLGLQNEKAMIIDTMESKTNTEQAREFRAFGYYVRVGKPRALQSFGHYLEVAGES